MGYDLVCRIWAQNMGPYFIEVDAQNLLIVNEERYRKIIIAPFVQDLKCFCRARNLPLRRQWMQQDGDTAHTPGESLACLQQHFGDRLISVPFTFAGSHVPRCLHMGHSERIFFSDQMTHYGNVPDLREKIVIFLCPCNNLCS